MYGSAGQEGVETNADDVLQSTQRAQSLHGGSMQTEGKVAVFSTQEDVLSSTVLFGSAEQCQAGPWAFSGA